MLAGVASLGVSGVALNLDVTDRRRLVVATIATLATLPAIWLFTRGEDATGPRAPQAAVVGVDSLRGASDNAPGTSTDPFGTNGPIFIDGPSTPPKPAVIQIVIPAASNELFVEGGASYSRMIGVIDDSCSAPAVPLGATITVTNRDNGRTILCINNYPAPLAPKLVVVMSTKLYNKLGALVDAPLPVRITW